MGDDDGLIDLYHHTYPETAEKIRRDRFFLSDDDEDRVYFTNAPGSASAGDFGDEENGGAYGVVHVRMPRRLVHEWPGGVNSSGEAYYDADRKDIRPEHVMPGDPLRREASSPRDYGMSHRPLPDGAPAHDLTQAYSGDVYTHPQYWAGAWPDASSAQGLAQLRKARGNPGAKVTIYRASGPGAPDVINPGDWVSLSAAYARLHAESAGEPGWRVHKAVVPAGQVRDAGTDQYREQGYWGPPVESRHHWPRKRGLQPQAAVVPPAERTESVRHMLDHYKPRDAGSWDEVRAMRDWDHPASVAFTDDVRRNGVLRPIPVNYEEDPPVVMNGHTRLLSADLAGRETVPTRQHEGFMDPDDPDYLGRGPEHPEHHSNWPREGSMPRTGISGEAAPEHPWQAWAEPSGDSPVKAHYDHLRDNPAESVRQGPDGPEWQDPLLTAPDHGPYYVVTSRSRSPRAYAGPPEVYHVVDRHGRDTGSSYAEAVSRSAQDHALDDWHRLTHREDPDEARRAQPHHRDDLDAVGMRERYRAHLAQHPPQFPHSRVDPADLEILKRPDARAAEPQGHSPSEEWHGPYEVVRHPQTGQFHVVDNAMRDVHILHPFPTQLAAERSRDAVDQMRQSKERGRALADSMYEGFHQAVDPGGTPGSRESDRNLQRGQDLMTRYEGAPGTIRMDPEDAGGRPYYEREHHLPGGRPSGWYARHYDGTSADVYHRATGDRAYDTLRLPEHPEDAGKMIRRPREGHGDEDLARELAEWHGEEGGSREHYEEDEPAIRRWRRQHLGSAPAGDDAAPEPPGPRPEWQAAPEGLSPEEGTAHFDRQQAIRHDWDRRVLHGLSTGRVAPQQAKDLGYYFNGDQTDRYGDPMWQQMPRDLYHVTTDVPGVMEHGLRTRHELGQWRGGGHGLGGGPDDTISLTSEHPTAVNILRAMHEFHHVVNGRLTPAQMWDQARSGAGAGRPFHQDIAGQWKGDWKDGDELPWGLHATLHGREHKMGGMLYTREEMERHHGPGWEPVAEAGHHDAPKGRIYYAWQRPLSPDRARESAASFYKTFAAFRAHAGGPEDPLFFSTDTQSFAAKDPARFGIVHVRPRPGAMGYPVSALGEWRTGSGDALDAHHAEGHAPRTAAALPLPNPHTGGDEWYHGSPYAFGGFHGDRPMSHLEDEYDGSHWNTLLGHHFTASHQTAEEFSRGEHSPAPDGNYDDAEPQQNVIHARLGIRNPRAYASEHDMDQEAYEREWRAGNHHDRYHDPEISGDGEDWEVDDRPATYQFAGHGDRMRGRDESDPVYWHVHRTYHPYATGWLNSHPDKAGIADRFRQHLISQGHDGITYGNEFEGRPGGGMTIGKGDSHHMAALPFSERQIDVTQRHRGPDCVEPAAAARQWPGRGQQPLFSEEEASSGVVAHFAGAAARDDDDEPGPYARDDDDGDFDHPEHGYWDEQHGAYRHPQHGWWCHACGEHHESAEEADEHSTTMTDWDHVYPGLPAEMHRGMLLDSRQYGRHMMHAYRDASPAEVARGVLHHLGGSALGDHWTPREEQARHYAVVGGGPFRPEGHDMNVVVHARKPDRDDIETDPVRLAERNVYGFDYHDDAEIPLREGVPVHVNGVSWKFHDDPDSAWQRHDFGAPSEHVAALEGSAHAPEVRRGLWYRAHPEDGFPIDPGRARSRPIGGRGDATGQAGLSAMAHPLALMGYLGHAEWYDLDDDNKPAWHPEIRPHRIIALHGREVGRGADDEPLIMPAADRSCCGKIVHDSWDLPEFDRLVDEHYPNPTGAITWSPLTHDQSSERASGWRGEHRRAALGAASIGDADDRDDEETGAGSAEGAWEPPAEPELPYVPPPPEGELLDHLAHHHGVDPQVFDLHLSPGNQGRWHDQEHAHRSWAFPKTGEVPHQHGQPRGIPGESQWPAAFQPTEHTDFTGGTVGVPGKFSRVLSDPEASRPFAPLMPSESSLSLPAAPARMEATAMSGDDEGEDWEGEEPAWQRIAPERDEHDFVWPMRRDPETGETGRDPDEEPRCLNCERASGAEQRHLPESGHPVPGVQEALDAAAARDARWDRGEYDHGRYCGLQCEMSHHEDRARGIGVHHTFAEGEPEGGGIPGEPMPQLNGPFEEPAGRSSGRYEVRDPSAGLRCHYCRRPLTALGHREAAAITAGGTVQQDGELEVVAHFEEEPPEHFDFYGGADREGGRPRTHELEEHIRGRHDHWRAEPDIEGARERAWSAAAPTEVNQRNFHGELEALHRRAHEHAEAPREGESPEETAGRAQEYRQQHHRAWEEEREEARQHAEAVAEHRENGSVQMHGDRVTFDEMEAHLRDAHHVPRDALPEYRLPTYVHGPDRYEQDLEEAHDLAHGESGEGYRHDQEGQYSVMHGRPMDAWDAESHLAEHHGFDISDLRRDEPSHEQMERMHAENHESDRRYLTHHLSDEIDEETGRPPRHEWSEDDEDRYQETGVIPGYGHAEEQLERYRHRPEFGDTEAPAEEGADYATAHSWSYRPYVAPPRSREALAAHLAEHHGTAAPPGGDSLGELIGHHEKLHDDRRPGDAPHQHDVPEGSHDPVFGSRQAALSDEDIRAGLQLPATSRERAREEGAELARRLLGPLTEDAGGEENHRMGRQNDAAMDLQRMYPPAESRGKHGFDEDGDPYYDLPHLGARNFPTGWYARHYGPGPEIHIRHRATGGDLHDVMDVADSPEHLPEDWGGDQLEATLREWHDDSGQGVREHLEENDPKITRWRQRNIPGAGHRASLRAAPSGRVVLHDIADAATALPEPPQALALVAGYLARFAAHLSRVAGRLSEEAPLDPAVTDGLAEIAARLGEAARRAAPEGTWEPGPKS